MQTQQYFDRMEQTAAAKLRVLAEYLYPGAQVLDFGSGPSDFVYSFVTSCGGVYTALDNSPIVQVMLAEKNIPSISEASIGTSCYDIIYMSSCFHEILSYMSRVEGRKTMRRIVQALKPNGLLIVRDWQTIPSSDAELTVKRTAELDAWMNAMFETGVLNGDLSRTEETITLHGANVYEYMMHVTWGLPSLERESQERYHFEPHDWDYFAWHLKEMAVVPEQDLSYRKYLSRLFSEGQIDAFFARFCTKETRVFRREEAA